MTSSDEIEDEPGNPWDESTTPVGSHFGESGDRIRSARIRGKTSDVVSKDNDQCHDGSDGSLTTPNGTTSSDFEVGNEVDRDEDLVGDVIGDDGDGDDEDDDVEGW